MSKSSASAIADNHTITAIQAARSLKQAMKAKRPVFLWGPPGIGKSDVVQQLAVELGGSKDAMIDLRMAQMEPTDIRGIPFFNKENGKMDWAPPVDLPDEELASQYPVIVLFLDEMNSAAPSVQAAGYQLILNRRIGKYKLPDNVVLIAADGKPHRPLPLARDRVTATFEQTNFKAVDVLNDALDPKRGWAIQGKIGENQHLQIVTFDC